MSVPMCSLAVALGACCVFIVGVPGVLGKAAASPVQAGATADLAVTIDSARVLDAHFLGFGVEWEYEFSRPDLNTSNSVWLKHWPVMLRRIDAMHPSILRVMLNSEDYLSGDGDDVAPDFNAPAMQGFFKLLDYARSRKIQVMLGVWHLPKPFKTPADARWASEFLGPLVRYLWVDRGYHNIIYFNLLNEPAASFRYEAWAQAIRNLHAALKAQGLDGKVKIVGSDGPGDFDPWIERIARDPDVRGLIGAYEYHLYAHLHTDKWLPGLLEGKLETGELAARRSAVIKTDPDGAAKPFFMGEAGIDDGNKGDVQAHRYDFDYGVWMADYAIQSMRAGQAGLIAWDMDDAMHTWGSYGSLGLKGWGFWNSLGGYKDYPEKDFDVRPWAYAWALMCRSFPRGCRTLSAPETGDPSVRVAAALLPGGGVSIAVVNEASGPRQVTIRVPGMQGSTLVSEYRYFKADRPADDLGFPVCAAHRAGNLVDGLAISLPSRGVVVVSTLAQLAEQVSKELSDLP